MVVIQDGRSNMSKPYDNKEYTNLQIYDKNNGLCEHTRWFNPPHAYEQNLRTSANFKFSNG